MAQTIPSAEGPGKNKENTRAGIEQWAFAAKKPVTLLSRRMPAISKAGLQFEALGL